MGIIDSFVEYFSGEKISSLVRVAALLFAGMPIIFVISRWTKAFVTKQKTPQWGMISSKIIYYVGLAIILFSVLSELGFKMSHLFGAAGIVGIAVGFASQTSVSNVISGLFLMTEQPFVVGDVVNIGDVTGQILSIDILSIKIRTFDNKLVRIPNENILKGQVTNITYFPIRRVDLDVGVAYKEDIGRVKEILMEVARDNPLCLQEPEPLFIFSGFGNSSIDLKFMVWAAKTDWLKVKNTIMEEIKSRFDQEGIEIPFPHLSLYAGSASDPIKVELTGAEKQAE